MPDPESSNDRSVAAVFDALKKDTQDKERNSVAAAKLTAETAKSLRDRLYRMIDYAFKREDWYVDQSHRLLQIGLALMASGVAICALSIKFDDLTRPTQLIGWSLGIVPFATGLLLAFLYARETERDHPYRKVVDIRSWYFAYLFPKKLPSSISKNPIEARQQVETVSNFICNFFDRWLERTGEEDIVREDLEQVAILLLLQRYRYQQVKAMNRCLFGGLLATGIVLLALGAFLLFGDRQASSPRTSGVSPSSATPTAASPESKSGASPKASAVGVSSPSVAQVGTRPFGDLRARTQDQETKNVAAAKLTGEESKSVRERLYHMIEYAIHRYDWYVDQSHRLLEIGLALIASGVAIFALFVKVDGMSRRTQVLGWLFGILPFLTGLILAFLYTHDLQRDYPHRKIVEIRSWYFIYEFSHNLPANLSADPTTARAQVDAVSNDILHFFQSWLEHTKDQDFVREDLEEVAILLILQRYGHQQVTEMTNWLFGGLAATFLVFIALGASWFRDRRAPLLACSTAAP